MTTSAIPRTGFLTSVASYFLFWLADLIRPGFVARYVSVHLFLLAAIIFGIWWTLAVREYRDWPFLQFVIAGLIGIVLGCMVWAVGSAFETYRLLAVALAAVVPVTVVAVVRNAEE